jgi:hypothetical protein
VADVRAVVADGAGLVGGVEHGGGDVAVANGERGLDLDGVVGKVGG